MFFSLAGKIVFTAPSRPLVVQQIEACHNVMGIPQVTVFLSFVALPLAIKFSIVHWLLKDNQMFFHLSAGLYNWHDRPDEPPTKGRALAKSMNIFCHSTSLGEGHPVWYVQQLTISFIHLLLEVDQERDSNCQRTQVCLTERKMAGICPMKEIVCLVVDEAHRATGNYSYCVVIQVHSSQPPLFFFHCVNENVSC
jgi:hypothetical protein